MLPELVFVTRLLGLVTGQQQVAVQVDPSVKAVGILIDGERKATLRAPWRLNVSFGGELIPHEITAIAYDEHGNEVGKDTQLVNLARPAAEAAIALVRDPDSGRLRATVRWQHIAFEKPNKIELRLDGKVIGKKATTLLPALEPYTLHMLHADVKFDGFTATKEMVFGGMYSEQMPAELTGVIATEHDQCFQSGDARVRAAAIENPQATVIFVRDSSAAMARSKLPMATGASREATNALHKPFMLPNASLRIFWPTSRQIEGDMATTVNLFDRSEAFDGLFGTHRILANVGGPTRTDQRYADAVSVAAVTALVDAKRRAVVLVLNGEHDDSRHDSGVVRRYLERIGVPLRVWSLVDITPEMTAAWGKITEITSIPKLITATEELRRMLEEQRIAWLPLEPLDALKAKPVACAR
ncbi:MAG: hypothetical protein DMF56_09120 [Acidobacteria bacterium]|nr:MAG: hypothetical protein DMF56_09120 [Acidobacteriota bacterium]